MGLFEKKIGPVFLKEDNNMDEIISRLEELKQKAVDEIKNEIEKQLTIVKYGAFGENTIAFELKNSGIDMYILHDLYLEYGDLSAQIDYMIITRKRTYVIECKNLIGDIEVNSNGDFIRSYVVNGKKIKEGFYSPITQNARHLNVIKELRKSSKGNIVTKMLFENYFDGNYKSLVVLANPKTVLNAKYAKKEIKDKIVRADQLINKIKELDLQVKDVNMSQKEMYEVANFFLSKDMPNKSDYVKKYEELVATIDSNGKSGIHSDNVASKVDSVNDREELVCKLKAFRLSQSKNENIKPYYIFNDSQMEDLIVKRPRTKEELLTISGFGVVKVEKYGEKILDILNHN